MNSSTSGKMLRGFTHESAYNESKEWYTPPEIFKAIGLRFDLDVASPGSAVVPWVPAERHFTMDDNGLSQAWAGRVWCNPPYGSDTGHWAKKFCQHRHGIMLIFARTDTTWFHRYVKNADVICFVSGRIRFIRHDGFSGGGSGAASILVGYGDDCVSALHASGLGFCMRAANQ